MIYRNNFNHILYKFSLTKIIPTFAAELKTQNF